MAELIDPHDLTALKSAVIANRLDAPALLDLLARKGWLAQTAVQALTKDLQQHPVQKPRSVPRHKLECRTFFAGGGLEGEGVVVDLSRSGCKVRCETVPDAGAELEINLFLPDYPRPLKVERSVVRWVKGERFGVEFLDIQASQRERLRIFLGSQSTAKP